MKLICISAVLLTAFSIQCTYCAVQVIPTVAKPTPTSKFNTPTTAPGGFPPPRTFSTAPPQRPITSRPTVAKPTPTSKFNTPTTAPVIDCKDPPPVTNGNRDFNCTVETCEVTYNCNSGYFLDGVENRTCQANRQWSGDSPTCPLIDCFDPPPVTNGNRDFNCTVETCEVTYTCGSRYFRVGVENRTCQSDGKWSENAPTCSTVDCGELTDPENGTADFQCTTYTCTANLTCDEGFIRDGPDKRTCGSNGNWTPENPVCIVLSCDDAYKAGVTQSGVYKIKVDMSIVDVYCDHSDGGGWTVFQRRVDGSVLFNRTWQEYKEGFGDLNTEFWLGNELVSHLTSGDSMTLRVNMMDFNNDTRYAEYTNFKVLPESNKYKLEIGAYNGTAGDDGEGLSYHNNRAFSTIDQDNDYWYRVSCAATWGGQGGWWYGFCSHANFNGFYNAAAVNTNEYMIWEQWKGDEQLKGTEMKFRPSNF